ncbi:2-acylglycerol O-acyltransferase 2-A-like [Ixodes scapularis]|uniref:2-acylglycerol O-acyltransferase 2-A-like n=1 Tax=Ixodes scapularis TaxID=6945 RepID=UPI001C393AE0|nr:2-acylglycerol O-acyltransferase 2-A-like [Ixodes scapularis]
MCAGAFGNFATEGTGFSELFPNIRPHLLVLKGQFRFPIHRDLLLSTGICASTPKSIDFILGAKQQDKGNAAVLVVGGAIEVLDAHPGSYRLYLSRRKGFVRKALQHGSSLVPVLSFGENELFVQASNPEGTLLRRCQAWLTRRLGFAPPIFHGRGVFQYSYGWLPFRKPVVTVVGAPLEVAKIEDPSDEEVDALHEKYTIALSRLFEDHKDLYAAPGAQLCIA